jgi:hypothetical protein
MKERWKTINGFEAYEVSDLGRVRRRLPGDSNRAKVGNLIKSFPNGVGYFNVVLCINKARSTKQVHRLVAEAFLPNPLNLPHVNHKKEKANNRAYSLEWRSTAGHGQDQARRGQHGSGVTYKKRTGRYEARIYLGSFSTFKEAAKVRKEALAALPDIL